MGNQQTIVSAEQIKKNIEDHKIEQQRDTQTKNEAMTYYIMDSSNFEANMILIKNALLNRILEASNVGQNWGYVYYFKIFSGFFIGYDYDRAISDKKYADRILERLRSFDELRFYKIDHLDDYRGLYIQVL